MCASRLLIVVALLVTPSIAQHFTSVIIKPSASSSPGTSRLRVLPSGDVLSHSVPVVELIGLAYDVPENPSPRLASLPEWAVHQRFDVETKTSVGLELDTKDVQTQRRTIGLLLQELLRERFGLVIRVRTVVTPVYALKLSGREQKLARSTVRSKDCILDTGSDGCHSFAIGFGHPLNARAADMFDLAHYLENWTDLPVVDRTATIGLFTMHSQGWRPIRLPPPPPGASGMGAEFANLSTLAAVLSSFGLQLRREEESLPFYTVERLNPPDKKLGVSSAPDKCNARF